jgi:hypothetical protein
MGIESLSALFATILGVSLATERLVTILKSAVPWLGDEHRNAAGQPNAADDRWRRLAVHAVAFGAAWLTAAFLVTPAGFDLMGQVPVGPSSAQHVPVPLVGLLASGGSAFWANVIAYAGAVKDISADKRTAQRLSNREKAKDQGVALKPDA